MSKLAADYINKFDAETWVDNTKRVKGCVAVDGVLLGHSDPSRVYFASKASGNGVRFELDRDDIVDAISLPEPIVLFGQTFKSARILLKLDALVSRVSLHVAAGLVEYDDRSITNVAGDTMRLKNTVVATVLMR